MNYELSICIPTYNRWECLRELLNSIINQIDNTSPVEICISDDASTDITHSFVIGFQKEYPHIRYFQFQENVGLDRNLLKAVSLANGEYCWLMGNDDKVEEGSINLISRLINEYNEPAVLNVNGWQYDNQLKARLYHMVKKGLKKGELKKNQLFNRLDDILQFFGDSFGFLGDNVFKRSLWNEIISSNDINKFIGSGYVHLAILLMMLQRDTRLLYVHQQCVGFRGNNDGFLQILGQFKRLKFDVVGYNQVAEGLFSKKSHLYKIWMSRIIKVHIFSRVLSLKLSKNNFSIHKVASLIYKHFGSLPAFWIYILPLLIIPRQVLLVIRAFYRLTIKRMKSR